MLRPDDIVQPTELCLTIIKQFQPYHRGVVQSRTDRYKCVNVKWGHCKKITLMARRYVEKVKVPKPR